MGRDGTPDLYRLYDSEQREISIDEPANDGFFHKAFDSPGGWAALQDEGLTYGVGLLYENATTRFSGWQRRGTFNNFRAPQVFGLAPRGWVVARAYLMLGDLDTIAAQARWLTESLAPWGVLDSPATDEPVGPQTRVHGWILDNGRVASASLLADGEPVADLRVDAARPDVCTVYPAFPTCPRVGFAREVDLGAIAPGAHLLEVEATDDHGNRRIVARRRVRR